MRPRTLEEAVAMGMTPAIPPLKPAPPNIAAFGEGDDPEPFQVQMRIVDLDVASSRHAHRAKLLSAVAAGVLLGALPFALGVGQVAGVAAVVGLLAVLAVAVFWSRSASTSALLAMSAARSALVPTFKVIEKEDKAE